MSDEILFAIQNSLGRIEAKVDGTKEWMERHTEEDKAVEDRVGKLELSQAKQKGALTVLGALASMVGAGVGYIIERFTIGHHP